jgi:segregation and condensation protein B
LADRDEDKIRRLEAVLFLSREPLTSRKLAEFARLEDGTQARTLVRRINERYNRAQRPYQIQQVAEGFQLLTRPQFASWLRRLQPPKEIAPLTPPALETLTVIAYRQPILKAEIEAIRGVNCSDILRQLMERDMVRISGRSRELGRPFLYATTRNFLVTFGLSGLDALPRADQLRGVGLPTWADPSQNQGTQTQVATRPADTSEESNVRLTSTPPTVEDLEAELGSLLGAMPVQAALDVRSADDPDEDFEDEDDLEDDDDEEEDEEEELDDEWDDDEWEEVDDDDDEWDEEEEDDEEEDDWEDDDEESDSDWE